MTQSDVAYNSESDSNNYVQKTYRNIYLKSSTTQAVYGLKLLSQHGCPPLMGIHVIHTYSHTEHHEGRNVSLSKS